MKRLLSVLLILLLLLSVSVLAADEPGEEGGEGAAAASAQGTENTASGENGGAENSEPEGSADPEEAEPEDGEEPTEEERSYVPGQFSDVAEDRWYGTEGQGVIKRVWELDLMVGMGDGTFQPEGCLRLSEAVKLAAVIHSRAVGDDVLFAPSTPWYQTYVDYAEATGILAPGEFDDLTAFATRAEMAHILAGALSESEADHVNAIFAISDVISTSTPAVPYSGDILRLYRAGILWGDAETHAFRPNDLITRAETAAAVIRMVLPEERQRLELLSVSGASGAIEQVYLQKESGETLCLGYHPWEEFFAFVGTESAVESADLYVSLDCDESLGYPVFGEEGSLIQAEYGEYTLEFMIADRNPMGVYVFRIESRAEGVTDSRGICIGTPLRNLMQAFPDTDLTRESGGTESVWFSGTLGEPAVVYRYAVSWDGRVSSIAMACAQLPPEG